MKKRLFLFMGEKNILRKKSFAFACRIVKCYQGLVKERREYLLSKQLLKSGTAIGALVRESEFAESRSDFVHKLAIALKEANETAYWLELLKETVYMNQTAYEVLLEELLTLIRLLAASIKTAKNNSR